MIPDLPLSLDLFGLRLIFIGEIMQCFDRPSVNDFGRY
jgi:hypothetical protein